MIKVGLCGIGSNGALHFQNALRMDGVKVEAVADASKNALNKAKKHGVKNLYADYNDLINSRQDLDAVVISLPNFLHYDCIMKSLEAGLNVFVEKPLASKVWQCEEIVNKVASKGLKVMVGHAMRYYPAIKKMREISLTGRIGSLEFFTAESIMNGPLAHGAVPR